jgi:hypothetical protein
MTFEGKNHELLKLVSHPSPSPYAVQVPICLVAGVHGDEPDGILAALEFARRFSRTPQLCPTTRSRSIRASIPSATNA